MVELVVIVEGETEQTFVNRQLLPHLALLGIIAWPVLPGKARKHGGVKNWEVARRDIVYTLRERRYCSTMFDYYALPQDWPGRTRAISLPWQQRADHVEQAIRSEIVQQMGDSFDPKRFIPYIQLHEFEALAFADTAVLGEVLAPLLGQGQAVRIASQFDEMLQGAGQPEAIDDGYHTCPSRRIASVVPAYQKRAQGPIITARIGLSVLRDQCPHFGNWLSRLEQIGT